MQNQSTLEVGQKIQDREGNEFVISSIIGDDDPFIDAAVTLKGAGGEKEIGSLDLKFFTVVMVAKFTAKDIKKPNKFNKKWFEIKFADGSSVNLAESKFDRRDWILFKRVFGESNDRATQDKGFVNAFSTLTMNLKEMKAELVKVANTIELD